VDVENVRLDTSVAFPPALELENADAGWDRAEKVDAFVEVEAVADISAVDVVVVVVVVVVTAAAVWAWHWKLVDSRAAEVHL